MSWRFRAVVTFPAAALAIPAIREVYDDVDKNRAHGWEIEDDDPVAIADDDANRGMMDEITDLLDKHKVPYDHWFGDSEDGGGEYTIYTRYDEEGDSLLYSSENESQWQLAEEVLALLDNDLDGAQATLCPNAVEVLRNHAGLKPPSLHEIDWAPPAS